jgi:hypothetical protein
MGVAHEAAEDKKDAADHPSGDSSHSLGVGHVAEKTSYILAMLLFVNARSRLITDRHSLHCGSDLSRAS